MFSLTSPSKSFGFSGDVAGVAFVVGGVGGETAVQDERAELDVESVSSESRSRSRKDFGDEGQDADVASSWGGGEQSSDRRGGGSLRSSSSS